MIPEGAREALAEEARRVNALIPEEVKNGTQLLDPGLINADMLRIIKVGGNIPGLTTADVAAINTVIGGITDINDGHATAAASAVTRRRGGG